MNYYWFNRQKILQEAKEKYSKEQAAEYYAQEEEAIKEKSRDIKTCHKKKKTRLRSTKENDVKNWLSKKKKRYKTSNFFVFSLI